MTVKSGNSLLLVWAFEIHFRVLLHAFFLRLCILPSLLCPGPAVDSLLVADHDLRGGVRQPGPLRDARPAQPLHLQDAEEEGRTAPQNLHQNPQRVRRKQYYKYQIPTAFSNTRSTIFCDVYQILPDTFHFLIAHLSARRSHKSVPCWEYIPNRTITIFIILLFQVLCGDNPDHHCCDVRSLSQLQSFHQHCRAH